MTPRVPHNYDATAPRTCFQCGRPVTAGLLFAPDGDRQTSAFHVPCTARFGRHVRRTMTPFRRRSMHRRPVPRLGASTPRLREPLLLAVQDGCELTFEEINNGLSVMRYSGPRPAVLR